MKESEILILRSENGDTEIEVENEHYSTTEYSSIVEKESTRTEFYSPQLCLFLSKSCTDILNRYQELVYLR